MTEMRDITTYSVIQRFHDAVSVVKPFFFAWVRNTADIVQLFSFGGARNAYWQNRRKRVYCK